MCARKESLVQRDEIEFNYAARHFGESSVIGNGRLGAMVYGDLYEERIALNESSVWSGSVQEADRPEAYKLLPEIRKHLFAGENAAAQELFYGNFTCAGLGSNEAQGANVPYGCYQVLGHLHIKNRLPDKLSDYRRVLNMEKAAVQVAFSHGETKYFRDYICSAAQEAFFMRLSADQAGKISFTASLTRPEHFTVSATENGLEMTGQLPNGTGGGGVSYACLMKLQTKNGTVSVGEDFVTVENADEAVLYVTAATDLQGFLGRECANALKAAAQDMETVWGTTYDKALTAHLEKYSPMYQAVRLELPALPQDNLDIVTRMKAYIDGGEDAGVLALCFNFGRYLLLCSSRDGGIPSNLQGLWAEEIQTPWNGNWHINAQQMVYWAAEICNMSPQHVPYLRLTEKLRKPGAKTARAYYHAGGWVAHTFTNPWGFTSPGEKAEWGSTVGSGAWLCHHMWEHYLYTMDLDYLRWAYPTMRECAEFFADYLIPHPEYGWLVTAPSSSPENHYYDKRGEECAVCAGPSYDSQLIYRLFDSCIRASKLLNEDAAFRAELQEKQKKLPPIRTGWDGRILEWLEEYEEALPYHRHLSHLWAVYPGYEIHPEDTPELALAAYKSVKKRCFTGPGWATAYRACVYARLQKAEDAYGQLRHLTGICCFPNLMNTAFHGSETIPVPKNPRFDECPDYARKPFQMDANSGATTAIALLFMDDKLRFDGEDQPETTIYLLPALPKALPAGKISGLVAKGGFVVSVEWEEGRLREAGVLAKFGGNCVLKYGERELRCSLRAGESVRFPAE